MTVHINSRFCKGCGLCASVCPKSVFELSTATNQKGFTVMEALRARNCVKCGRCEIVCPDMAIWIEDSKGQ